MFKKFGNTQTDGLITKPRWRCAAMIIKSNILPYIVINVKLEKPFMWDVQWFNCTKWCLSLTNKDIHLSTKVIVIFGEF
jgi:hypothetical protein